MIGFEMNSKTVILNGKVVFPEVVKHRNVVVEGGIITYVGDNPPIGEHDYIVNAKDKYVLPGFIDIHSNGAFGFDISAGLYDQNNESFLIDKNAFSAGLHNALKFYLSKGTTKVTLSSIAGPIEQIEQSFKFVSEYLKERANDFICDVFAGLYIEGTFMKMEQYRGAQNPEYFYTPSIELFERLHKAADNRIKIVNIPPEHNRPGLDLIEYLYENKIIAAAGHTGATARQYERAIEKGLTLAVHFLNGPTGSSTKPFDGGGAVEAILRCNDVFVELITEGYHVSPQYVLDTIKRKGFRKTLIITDSMFLTGMKDVKTFEMFGIKGKVSDSGKYLKVAESEQTLFGSILTMDIAFSNVLTWLTRSMEGIWHLMHGPLDFDNALINTSRMCSQVPARLLGIYRPDERKVNQDLSDYTGSIEVGKKADIVIADIQEDKQGYHLEIDKVFLKGNVVDVGFRSAPANFTRETLLAL